MLSQLTIKNVALIESATINFCQGLNILSGETGAGKSVILDSVNFVLGAKADRTMIRYGETECMVKAEFIVAENSKAVETLREMDIDSEGEIIISRRYSESGKTSIKINGSTVTAAMLRKVTDCLVDVHGQSEHFFLLKESNQLKTLDAAIGASIVEKKAELADYLVEKRKIDDEISMLGGDEQERAKRLDMLSYQIQEIEDAALQEGEEEDLQAKRNKINNLEKIILALQESSSVFQAERGVLDGLRMAKRSVGGIARLDDEYNSVYDRLEGLFSEAEDIAETLSGLADDLYFDENEAQRIEDRLDIIRSLKKKYGRDLAEISAYYEGIRKEYELLSDCEGQYARLTEKREGLNKKIFRVCKAITECRKRFGEVFCKDVTDELKTLNIASACFEIEFNEYTTSAINYI